MACGYPLGQEGRWVGGTRSTGRPPFSASPNTCPSRGIAAVSPPSTTVRPPRPFSPAAAGSAERWTRPRDIGGNPRHPRRRMAGSKRSSMPCHGRSGEAGPGSTSGRWEWLRFARIIAPFGESERLPFASVRTIPLRCSMRRTGTRSPRSRVVVRCPPSMPCGAVAATTAPGGGTSGGGRRRRRRRGRAGGHIENEEMGGAAAGRRLNTAACGHDRAIPRPRLRRAATLFTRRRWNRGTA